MYVEVMFAFSGLVMVMLIYGKDRYIVSELFRERVLTRFVRWLSFLFIVYRFR